MRSKPDDFASETYAPRAASDSRDPSISPIDIDQWGNEWENDDAAIDEDLFYD